jgi:cystathionine beta-synthase
MIGEVAGAVSERELLDAVFSGAASLADRVDAHMSAPLPLIGSGEPVDAARAALEKADALMVVDDGRPVGVLTRHDLLGFLAR